MLGRGLGGKELAGKGQGVWHGIGITTSDGWGGRGMMRGRERAAGEHRVHAARLPWLHGGCLHPQPRLSIAAIPHSLPITPSFQHPPLPPLACLHSSKCSGHYQCLHFCLCLCCLHFEGNKVQLCLLTRNLCFSPHWALFFPPAPSTPRLVPSITPWLGCDPPGGGLKPAAPWGPAPCGSWPPALVCPSQSCLAPAQPGGLRRCLLTAAGTQVPPRCQEVSPPRDNASG